MDGDKHRDIDDCKHYDVDDDKRNDVEDRQRCKVDSTQSSITGTRRRWVVRVGGTEEVPQ